MYPMRFRGHDRPVRITLMEEDPFRQTAPTQARSVIPDAAVRRPRRRVVTVRAVHPPC